MELFVKLADARGKREDNTDLYKLIWLVEVGNLSRAQDVVDVLQEGFIDNLRVIEEKHCGLVVHPS